MYNWIETTFNVSGGVTQAIAVILALTVVLLLFALFIFILKRLMGGQTTQNRSRQPRIAVMDSATIDARRRLVLVRRDNIEHLILIGGPSDVVVEQNILRNTPLAQQRPGQPAGLATAVPLRAPMAPGPDIPVRPDDLAAQQDTAPSPVQQARAPAEPQAERPAQPVSSLAARETPTAPVSETRSPAPAPAVSHMEPAPSPQASTEPLPKSRARAPVAATGADRSSNRAADLLKAATQNGFSRTLGRETASPQKTAVEPAVSSPVEADVADRPVDSSTDKASQTPPAAGKSPLKALARPFSPRERPSYGGHSISPPASGPAARAKTALLNPKQDQAKVEPVLQTPSASVAAVAPDAQNDTQSPADGKQADIVEDKHPDTAASPTSTTAPKTEDTSKADSEPAPAAMESSSSDISGGSETEDGDSRPSPETLASAAEPDETQKSGNTPSKQSATEQQPDISLDMSDLLEDVPNADTPSEITVQGESVSDEKPPLEQEQAISNAASQQQSATAPAVLHKPVDQTKPVEAVKAAPRPTGGIGDKNPIEDEMAKILDELGGQPN